MISNSEQKSTCRLKLFCMLLIMALRGLGKESHTGFERHDIYQIKVL